MFTVTEARRGCVPVAVSAPVPFAEAKAILLAALLVEADEVGARLCGVEECAPGCACDLDNAAQDVNLWGSPGSIVVGGMTWAIRET